MMMTMGCLLFPALLLAQSSGYPPLGKLVDVGGFNMHIYTTGKGELPVILLPGSGHFSLHWNLVQTQVEKFAKVSSIDYAGTGWSDYGPLPQTLAQRVHNVHTLLTKAGIGKPYILVGQSLGGLLARKYAQTYPQEIAGVIMVDATVPDMLMLTYKTKQWEHWRKRAKKRVVPVVKNKLTEPVKFKVIEKGLRRDLGDLSMFSEQVQKLFHWLNTKPLRYPAKSGGYYLPEELEQLYNDKKPYPLDNKPLLILAARQISKYKDTNLSNKERMKHKLVTQKKMLKLSQRSQLEWVETGHHIHIEKPELVTAAIKKVMKQLNN